MANHNERGTALINAIVNEAKSVAHGGETALRQYINSRYPNVTEETIQLIKRKIKGGADRYAQFAEMLGPIGGADGGCGCRIGGVDLTVINKYGNSINSKTKRELVKRLIDAAERIGLKASGSTDEEKLRSIVSSVPSGDAIKADAGKQSALCKKIAQEINAHFGTNAIDVTLPAEVLCQQVAEVLSSLTVGMHTEFLGVYNDIHMIMRNLEVLKNELVNDWKLISAKIDEHARPEDYANLRGLHTLITDEIDRQLKMLTNLLHVPLSGSERDIAGLLKDADNIAGRIEEIDVKTGEKGFGKVISDVLRGLGVTATLAHVIDNALKTVGMTMDEYVNNKSLRNLRDKVLKGITTKDLHGDDLVKYMEAAKILYENFSRADDIGQVAKRMSGAFEPGAMTEQDEIMGGCDTCGGAEHDEPIIDGGCDTCGGVTGGDDSEYRETDLEKRVRAKDQTKTLILESFYSQIVDNFQQFVTSLDVLSKKVGGEIPITDELENFRRSLQQISESLYQHHNIYYALIGYHNDALSLQHKDAFVADLKMIKSHLDALAEMPAYSAVRQYFKDMVGYINAILGLIDSFSEQISKFIGVVNYKGSAEPEGGADLTRMPNIKYRPAKTVTDSLRQFDYRMRTAKIYENFQRTSKELESYAENYQTLVTSSLADMLRAEKAKYDARIKWIDDKTPAIVDVLLHGPLPGDHDDVRPHTPDGIAMVNGIRNNTGNNDNNHRIVLPANTSRQQAEALARENIKTMKEFTSKQWEAKQKFWETVEAIDTYMRVFTDAIVKNPRDALEIKTMLDSVNVISDWYNEKSGEDIADIFDMFPHDAEGQSFHVLNNNMRAAMDALNRDVQEVLKDFGSTLKHVNLQNSITRYIAIVDNYANAIPNQVANGIISEADKNLAMYSARMAAGAALNIAISAADEQRGDFAIPNNFAAAIDDLIANGVLGTEGKDRFAPNAQGGGIEQARRASVDLSKHLGIFGQYIRRMDQKAPNNSHYYARNPRPFGNPTNRIDVKAGEEARMRIGGVFVNLSVLKNLMSVFHYIGAKFGGEELHKKVFMSPGQMYKNLVEYIQASSFVAYISNLNTTIHSPFGVKMVATDENYVALNLAAPFDLPAFNFDFEKDYFVMVLKSIAAKVLTVTGMCDVFEHPMEFNGINTIRLITGGASETPKIEEGAVELYMRLPLLAQFYRKIFNWNRPAAEFRDYNDLRRRDTNIMISMVPDVEGVFSGLINVVFRKTGDAETTMYTDDEIVSIIRECNLIYQRMRETSKSGNVVKDTIDAFVAEVNRRYGIVSKRDRDQFEDQNRFAYDYAGPTMDSRYEDTYNSEIAILPGETDEEVDRPSGARRLLGAELAAPSKPKKSPYNITLQHRDIINRFRCAIDQHFANPDEAYSFVKAIKQVQDKLSRETRPEERFNIVAGLIRGHDIYTKVDSAKYILFHETVITGLNMLSAIHTVLGRLKQRVLMLDPALLERVLMIQDAAARFNTMVRLVEDASSLDLDAQERVLIAGILRINARAAGAIQIANAPREIRGTFDATYQAIDNVPINQAQLDAYRNWVKTGTVGATARNTFVKMRYGADADVLMRELLSIVMTMSKDFQSLVDVRIERGKLHMSFDGLKSAVIDLFNHVNYFIEKLRPHIRRDVYDRYINKTTTGSYYWLREQIMEKMIMGRPERVDPDTGVKTKQAYLTIDQLAKKLHLAYNRLTQEWPYFLDFTALNVNLDNAAGTNDDTKRDAYGDVFAEFVYYDNNSPDSGLFGSSKAHNRDRQTTELIDPPMVIDYVSNDYDKLHLFYENNTLMLDLRYAARYNQFYTWEKEYTPNRSALFSFNQLIAKMIQSFYDRNKYHIYGGLINGLASLFHPSLTDFRKTYPDMHPVTSGKFNNVAEVKYTTAEAIKFELPPPVPPTWESGVNGLAHILDIYQQNVGHFGIDAYSQMLNRINDRTGVSIFWAQLLRIALALVDGDPAIRVDPLYFTRRGGNERNKNEYHRERLFGEVSRYRPPPGEGQPAQRNLVVEDFSNNNNIGLAIGYLFERANEIARLPDEERPQYALPTNVYRNIAHAFEIMTNTAPYYLGIWQSIHNYVNFDDRNMYPQRIQLIASLIPAVARAYTLAVDINGNYLEDVNVKNLTQLTRAFSTNRTMRMPSPGDDAAKTRFKYDDIVGAVTNRAGERNVTTIDPVVPHMFLARNDKNNQMGTHMFTACGFDPNDPSGLYDQFYKIGKLGDPDREHVLFTSLARILANVIASGNATVASQKRIADTITDLTNNMKETMRANLPQFRNLFQSLISRCEILKMFMKQPEIVLNRGDTGPYLLRFVLLQPVFDSRSCKDRYTGVLNRIIEGCETLAAACDQVLREVGDDAKYFETHYGSIQDFKTRYQTDPFMPLSATLSIMQNADAANYMDFFPVHTFGEVPLKYAYGVRSIFGNIKNKVSLESVTGFNNIIEQYNVIADAPIDKKMADGFLKSFIVLAREFYELKHIRGNITPYVTQRNTGIPEWYGNDFRMLYWGALVRGDVVTDRYVQSNRGVRSIVHFANPADYVNSPVGRPAYPITHSIERIVTIIESNFIEENTREIVEYFASEAAVRNTLDIQNIIDLNIVPINVHALMREIPLANLYNYSYTADRLIIELFYGGSTNANAKALIQQLCSRDGPDGNIYGYHLRTSKDMLVALLLDPYRTVNTGHENNGDMHMLRGIFIGAAANGQLGRPKFLSDQLYNKVLLQNMYRVRNVDGNIVPEYDENGPQMKQHVDQGNNYTYLSHNAGQHAPNDMYAPAARDNNEGAHLQPRPLGDNRNIADPDQVKTVNRDGTDETRRAVFGRRFNNMFIRNLIFIVNLWRSLRFKMHADLLYDKEIVRTGNAVTDPTLTEYFGNEIYTPPPQYDASFGKFRYYADN